MVPGTIRDSLYILDLLLHLDGGPRPDMVVTDQAAYTDIVFGLFRILGYDGRKWPHALSGTPWMKRSSGFFERTQDCANALPTTPRLDGGLFDPSDAKKGCGASPHPEVMRVGPGVDGRHRDHEAESIHARDAGSSDGLSDNPLSQHSLI